MVLATTPPKSKKNAPINKELKSSFCKFAPKNNLATCGMTNPIQPIVPDTLTAKALATLTHTKQSDRNSTGLIPKLKLCASLKLNKLMRHLNKKSGMKPKDSPMKAIKQSL